MSDFCLLCTFVCFSRFSTLIVYYFLISKKNEKKKHFNFKFHIGDKLTRCPEQIQCGHGSCPWVPPLATFLSKLEASHSSWAPALCGPALCSLAVP